MRYGSAPDERAGQAVAAPIRRRRVADAVLKGPVRGRSIGEDALHVTVPLVNDRRAKSQPARVARRCPRCAVRSAGRHGHVSRLAGRTCPMTAGVTNKAHVGVVARGAGHSSQAAYVLLMYQRISYVPGAVGNVNGIIASDMPLRWRGAVVSGAPVNASATQSAAFPGPPLTCTATVAAGGTDSEPGASTPSTRVCPDDTGTVTGAQVANRPLALSASNRNSNVPLVTGIVNVSVPRRRAGRWLDRCVAEIAPIEIRAVPSARRA